MVERKIRILLGKLGEGHKEALLALARNFSEAGFEVIYTELQEPDAIVSSAIQESVDHIGVTTLPGADIQAFAEIRRLLRKANSDHITVTAGGFLDENDIPLLRDMGVMEFFPKGTPFEKLVEWSKKNIRHKP
jgi:methylmalonyl-CoA mutase C-terminal domain/subunit